MRRGDLVTIGDRSKYNAANSVTYEYVDVFPSQVGLLIAAGTNDSSLTFRQRCCLALFGVDLLSFAPGVLEVAT